MKNPVEGYDAYRASPPFPEEAKMSRKPPMEKLREEIDRVLCDFVQDYKSATIYKPHLRNQERELKRDRAVNRLETLICQHLKPQPMEAKIIGHKQRPPMSLPPEYYAGKPPEVEAVKEILRKQTDFEVDIGFREWTIYKGTLPEDDIGTLATQIRQLFKVKLPENPYKGTCFDNPSDIPPIVEHIPKAHELQEYDQYIGFKEALQQVKELNPDMEVEDAN